MPEFSPVAQHWVNVVLIWIGFGALAGMAARLFLPSGEALRLPVLTLGIAGSAMGLGMLSWATGDRPFNPISPLGILSAMGGALVLLLIYRAIHSLFPKEPEKPADAE
jgi:uncharacterized membrane protein YeaQ/YmgE (transglycosylase-associated protein family)